jgi:hypothetical protein
MRALVSVSPALEVGRTRGVLFVPVGRSYQPKSIAVGVVIAFIRFRFPKR